MKLIYSKTTNDGNVLKKGINGSLNIEQGSVGTAIETFKSTILKNKAQSIASIKSKLPENTKNKDNCAEEIFQNTIQLFIARTQQKVRQEGKTGCFGSLFHHQVPENTFGKIDRNFLEQLNADHTKNMESICRLKTGGRVTITQKGFFRTTEHESFYSTSARELMRTDVWVNDKIQPVSPSTPQSSSSGSSPASTSTTTSSSSSALAFSPVRVHPDEPPPPRTSFGRLRASLNKLTQYICTPLPKLKRESATGAVKLDNLNAVRTQLLSPAPEGKLPIAHIAQKHRAHDATKYDPNSPAHEEILKSQYDVAATILQLQTDCNDAGKSLIVLDENQIDRDLSKTRMDGSSDMAKARKLFPRGLPTKYDELNSHQKEFLFTHGGPKTVYFLSNHLDRLYTTMINQSTNTNAHGDDENANDYRERAVLDRAQSLAAGNPKAVALVVFGAGHDFTDKINFSQRLHNAGMLNAAGEIAGK